MRARFPRMTNQAAETINDVVTITTASTVFSVMCFVDCAIGLARRRKIRESNPAPRTLHHMRRYRRW